jgi:hypothetical protein
LKYLHSILLATSLLFVGCKENTQDNTIIPDVASISIDENNITLYSTDAAQTLHATVHYTDGSTDDGTNFVRWESSNKEIAFFKNDSDLKGGTRNGGDVNITIDYDSFSDLRAIHIYALRSYTITHNDINATGTYQFQALGTFENNETNRTIINNIYWSANNGATIELENGIANITLLVGDTNITTTLFKETNSSSPIAPQSVIIHID